MWVDRKTRMDDEGRMSCKLCCCFTDIWIYTAAAVLRVCLRSLLIKISSVLDMHDDLWEHMSHPRKHPTINVSLCDWSRNQRKLIDVIMDVKAGVKGSVFTPLGGAILGKQSIKEGKNDKKIKR